ncbi:MAG: cyclase family protein, partial [Candidatus Aenigmarchaeota archaeon]|nr:cyclase family protein [Candidatus Aenigmarchaeota archaeon]
QDEHLSVGIAFVSSSCYGRYLISEPPTSRRIAFPDSRTPSHEYVTEKEFIERFGYRRHQNQKDKGWYFGHLANVSSAPKELGDECMVDPTIILTHGHTGTHIDKPVHVDSDAAEEPIPKEALLNRAIIANVGTIIRERGSKAITPDVLEETAKRGGFNWCMPIFLIRAYDKIPTSFDLDPPYLTPEAGEFLAATNIYAVGGDYASSDHPSLPEVGRKGAHYHLLTNRQALTMEGFRFDDLPDEIRIDGFVDIIPIPGLENLPTGLPVLAHFYRTENCVIFDREQ